MDMNEKTRFGFTPGNIVNFVAIIGAAVAVWSQARGDIAYLKADMQEVKGYVRSVPVIENDVAWLKRQAQAQRGGVAFNGQGTIGSVASIKTNVARFP
jgi:hypothetical protein